MTERLAFPPLTPAIRLLLLANTAVFVANALLLGRLSDAAAGGSGFWFAFSWGGLLDGYGLGLLRVLSYQFTHSFADPMHFGMNMLVLYFFGTMAERRLGRRGALRLYLVGGTVGALGHLAVAAAQGHADVPLVGASGACYAFLAYAATMAPNSGVIFLVVRVPLWLLAAILVAIGVYSTFVEFATGYPGGVSHGAHLGGAVLGFAACRRGWFVDWQDAGAGPGMLATLRARWDRRRAARKEEAAAARELQLDDILAKVKREGLAALSADERRFLERASRERARS
ncbi:MAG: rhomboid family intramembrane serine protease [Planctomycetota bacterium]